MKTNKTFIRQAIPALLGLGSVLPVAFAGTPADIVAAPAPAPSGWEFRLEPYGWLTATEGTAGVGYRTSEVDSSFGDIFDHIEMVGALQFEARNGRWGIIADGFYARLAASGSPPGPLLASASIEYEQFFGELYGAYRITECSGSFLDLYAGIRYNDISMELTGIGTIPLTSFRVSQSENWTDPVIGVRGQWSLNDKVYLAAKADVGGFGTGSDIAWSIQGTLGYNFTRSVSAEIGYRYFKTEYANRGFTYDIAQSGIYTGVNVKF
ncbi:MAG: hypothetical protein QM755_24775 [Luteolibacter sp.]